MVVAVDTSVLITYGQGGDDAAVRLFLRHLQDGSLALPSVVLSEVFSARQGVNPELLVLLQNLRMLAIEEGYFLRTGLLRASILRQGKKCRLADALIAQQCLDAKVAIISRDADFRHFAEAAGLEVLG